MTEKTEALRLADYMDHPLNDPNDVADAVSSELRRLSAVEAELLAMQRVFSEAGCTFDVAYIRRLLRAEAQRDALLGLLKEARKIIRASSSRNLVKDWDQRTTDAIKAAEKQT